MFFSSIRLKNLLFQRLSKACIYSSDVPQIRYIISHLSKHLLEEFLFNSDVLTLDSFDRLLLSVDTRHYWRLHLSHMKLSNEYWLEEIHRFLSDSFPSNSDLSPEKEFYFKIHFYCHIFYHRDLLVHISNNQYLNILCIPLKYLNKKFNIKYISKSEINEEYYQNNKQIRLIITQLEQTLWLSYIKEVLFDYFEYRQWIKFLPYVNYFQPNKFQLFIEQTSSIDNSFYQLIKPILKNKNLQSISIINKYSLMIFINLLDYINTSITDLTIELMNGDYCLNENRIDRHIEYNICYLIQNFSQTLTSLELKRISLSSKLVQILSRFINRLYEFSFETSISFYKTIQLLKNLFSEKNNLKQLKLNFISRRYWINQCINPDEKEINIFSNLNSLNLNNFHMDLNDMNVLKELLLLPTLTHIKLANMHCEKNSLAECLRLNSNLIVIECSEIFAT